MWASHRCCCCCCGVPTTAECFEAPSPQLCPCVLVTDCATRLSFHAHSSQACRLLEVRTMVFWTLRLCIPLLLSWDFGVRPCMHTATSSWTFGSHPHSHSVEHLLEHLHPLLAVLSQLFCHIGFVNSLCLVAVGYAFVSWVLGSQPLAVC